MLHQGKTFRLIVPIIFTFLACQSEVFAAGFELREQGSRLLGTAYAGTAAIADDATTAYYNTAGLTRLSNEEIAVSAVSVVPHARLNAFRATPTFTTIPFRGRNFTIPGSVTNIAPGSARSRSPSLIPALHYARRLSDCFVFGLSIAMPFGLDVKYRIDSVARYLTTRASIRTYDISPNLAYSFGNGVSIGAGLDCIHTLAKIDTRIGFGFHPLDGYVENTVSRWALGGHAGILYQSQDDCYRIGLQYRSGFKVHGHGRSIIVTPVIPTPLGRIPSVETLEGVRANLRLPDTVVLSDYVKWTENWAVLAEIQWTHWKKFDQIRAYFDDKTVFTQRFNFKDSMRYAIGTEYQFTECWLGRLGVALDKSPVRDEWRTTFIPDSDRYWVAFGFQYRFNECLTMDLGYAHIFFKNASINQGPPNWTRLVSRQSVQGRYRSRADLVGMQLAWKI